MTPSPSVESFREKVREAIEANVHLGDYGETWADIDGIDDATDAVLALLPSPEWKSMESSSAQSQPCGLGPADLEAGLNVEPAASETWPRDGVRFRDAPAFVALVARHPGMWGFDSALKYLGVQIDTREGCCFILSDRDGNRIEADRVMAAIRAWREAYPALADVPQGSDSQALTALERELLAALKRVRSWINTQVPIGTEAATTMLGIVTAAIAKALPPPPEASPIPSLGGGNSMTSRADLSAHAASAAATEAHGQSEGEDQ